MYMCKCIQLLQAMAAGSSAQAMAVGSLLTCTLKPSTCALATLSMRTPARTQFNIAGNSCTGTPVVVCDRYHQLPSG